MKADSLPTEPTGKATQLNGAAFFILHKDQKRHLTLNFKSRNILKVNIVGCQ